MRRSTAALTVLLLSACGGSDGNEATGSDKAPAAANVTMQPGQWEMTTRVTSMTAEGMPPGVTPPPTTISICMTPEQAANPSANFASGSREDSGCTSENMAMRNGRVSGTVQCSQGGQSMRSTLDGRFTATSYEVTQRAEISGGGVNITTESQTSGRRTGDCAAGS